MNVRDIFDSMDYGPAPESADEALAWIKTEGPRFGHFIGGSFTKPGKTFATKNPATGKELARISQGTDGDVKKAVAAARKALSPWQKLGGHGRARVLYALARALQKHARLFAVLESLDNGKPIRESRDIDIPLAIRHFYHHAGLAQLLQTEAPGKTGIGVAGQIIPWNFPLLMLAWKIAPALAAGCTTVLKPAEYTSLTALLFARICQEAGVPPGVINIVTGDGKTGAAIVDAKVDKIAFTGSTSVGRRIREATAGRGIGLTLELGGKSPYIVFKDADIDSAIEGLVDAIWFNQGQVCCAGSRLIVQEGIAADFYTRLKARMDGLRVGDPLDKVIDVGAIVDPVQHQTIQSMVEGNSAGETYHASCPMPETGCFYPPTLITGLAPSDTLMQEEIFGPVLVGTTFRTPAEAVEMANNTRYGLAATLWTENVNLALDVAPKLAAGVVWVNATNLFDAAAPFGGIRESGFGREGGWEGLSAYLKPDTPLKKTKPIAPKAGKSGALDGVDRTAKLYVGGKQSRPDGGYSTPIYSAKGELLGQVPKANRKDVRNAVEAMNAAKGWSKTSGHLRAQILYYLAENLDARADEFASRINTLSGQNTGKDEVTRSIERLFTAAAWADKWDGSAKSVPIRGIALAMKEPVGKIAAFLPDAAALLAPVTALGAALATGNRITLVASQPFPLVLTDLYQVLETSDVPAGVVNILTGDHGELAPTFADHLDVDAVWSFSSSKIGGEIERRSAGNLKRTWDCSGLEWDWCGADMRPFLEQSSEVKTVWVPYGE